MIIPSRTAHGRLAIEHYTDGTSRETLFNSYSLIKSLIGTLILKAIADGKITGLDTPVGEYLMHAGDAAFRAVPLRAFLEMRSGILFETDGIKSVSGAPTKDLEAVFANPFGPLARLHMGGPDTVFSSLTADPAARGTYNYQNINTSVLGSVLEQVYGHPLPEILSEKIWKPAGAGPAKWRKHTNGGPVAAYCCLYAKARDWIKAGVYLARNGISASDPFLPVHLWDAFMGARFSPAGVHKGQYGLHVRHNVLDREGEALQGRFTYFLGRGGQIVYLMPQEDLVVVRFGDGAELLHSTLYATWRALHPAD